MANGRGEQDALIYDSPVTNSKRRYSYAQLLDEVSRFAGVLAAQGVGKGDRVIVYMPMVPEALIAMLACARLGAVHSVVFGGFASNELAVRIEPAPPGETALLLVGTESVELPFDGGTLLVLPQLLLEFGVDASGVGALEASLGNAPALCGAELFLQSIHREAGAGGLFDTVQTNGLRLVIGS